MSAPPTAPAGPPVAPTDAPTDAPAAGAAPTAAPAPPTSAPAAPTPALPPAGPVTPDSVPAPTPAPTPAPLPPPAPTPAPPPPPPVPAPTQAPVDAAPTTVPPPAGGGVNMVLAIALPVVLVVVMLVVVILAVYYYRWRHLKKYDIQTAVEKADKEDGEPGSVASNRKSVLPRSDSRKSIGKAEILIRTPSREGFAVPYNASKSTKKADLYVVRHFYAAQDSSQLSLQTGRIVEVLEKLPNGWWRGLTDDKEGWFPANYVRKLDVSEKTSSIIIESEEPNGTAPGADNEGFITIPLESPDEAKGHTKVKEVEVDNVPEVKVVPESSVKAEADPKRKKHQYEEIDEVRGAEEAVEQASENKYQVAPKRKPHQYEEIDEVRDSSEEGVEEKIENKTQNLLKRKPHQYEEIDEVREPVEEVVTSQTANKFQVAPKSKPHQYEEVQDVRDVDVAVENKVEDPVKVGMKENGEEEEEEVKIEMHDEIDDKIEAEMNNMDEQEMEGFINQIFSLDEEDAEVQLGHREVNIDSAVKRQQAANRATAEEEKRREAENDRVKFDHVFDSDDEDQEEQHHQGSWDKIQMLPNGKASHSAPAEEELILSVNVSKANTQPFRKTEPEYEEYDMDNLENGGAYDPVDIQLYDRMLRNSVQPQPQKQQQKEQAEDELQMYENIDFGKVQEDIMSGGMDDVLSDGATTDFSTDSFSPMPPTRKKRSQKNGERSHVAMYPFTPSHPDHLALSRNDVLLHVDEAPNGWIKGRNKETGKEGWFPESYVREGRAPRRSEKTMSSDSDDLSDEFDEEEPTGMEYTTMHTYKGQEAGDLSFSAGERVIVIETLPTGWWRGYIEDREGWFPGSYVEAVPPSTPTSQDSGFNSVCPPEHDFSKRSSEPIMSTSLPSLTPQRRSEPPVPFSQGSNPSLDNDSSSAVASKPQVPKRYVAPKLVKIPKKFLQDSSSPERQPMRPVPPVPPVRKSSILASKAADTFIAELQQQLHVASAVSADTGRGNLKRQEAVDSGGSSERNSTSLERQGSEPGSRSGTLSRKRNSIPRPSVPPPKPPSAAELLPQDQVETVDTLGDKNARKLSDEVFKDEEPHDNPSDLITDNKAIVKQDSYDDDDEEFDMRLFSKTFDKEDDKQAELEEEVKDSYESQLNEDIAKLELVIAKHRADKEQEKTDIRPEPLNVDISTQNVIRASGPKITSPRESLQDITVQKPKVAPPPKPVPPKPKLQKSESTEKPERPPVPKNKPTPPKKEKPSRPMSPPVRPMSPPVKPPVQAEVTPVSDQHKTPPQLHSSADYQAIHFKAGVTPPLKKFTPMSVVEFSDLDDLSLVDPSDEERAQSPKLLDINKYILNEKRPSVDENIPNNKTDKLEDIKAKPASILKDNVPNLPKTDVEDLGTTGYKPTIKPKRRPERPNRPPRINSPSLEDSDPVPPPRVKSLSPDRPPKPTSSPHRPLSPLGIQPPTSEVKKVESVNPDKLMDNSAPPVSPKPAVTVSSKPKPQRPTSPPVKPPMPASKPLVSLSKSPLVSAPPPRPLSPPVLPKPSGTSSVPPKSLSPEPKSKESPVTQRLSSYESIVREPFGTKLDSGAGDINTKPVDQDQQVPSVSPVSYTSPTSSDNKSRMFNSSPQKKDDDEFELSFTSTYEPPDYTFVSEDLINQTEEEDEDEEKEDDPQELHDDTKLEDTGIDLMSDFMSEFEKRFSVDTGDVSDKQDSDGEEKVESPADSLFSSSIPVVSGETENAAEPVQTVEDYTSGDMHNEVEEQGIIELQTPPNEVDETVEAGLKYEPLNSIPEQVDEEVEEPLESEDKVEVNNVSLPDLGDVSEDLLEEGKKDLSLMMGSEVVKVLEDIDDNDNDGSVDLSPAVPDSEPPPIPSCPPPMEDEDENNRVEDQIKEPIVEPKAEEKPETISNDAKESVMSSSTKPVIAPHLTLQKYMIPGARRKSLDHSDERKPYNPVTNRFAAGSSTATSKFPWHNEYRGNIKAPTSPDKVDDRKEEDNDTVQMVNSMPSLHIGYNEDKTSENIVIPTTSAETEKPSESIMLSTSPPKVTTSPSSDTSPLRFFTPSKFVAKHHPTGSSIQDPTLTEANNNESSKEPVTRRPSFGTTGNDPTSPIGYHPIDPQKWAYAPIGFSQNRNAASTNVFEEEASDV